MVLKSISGTFTRVFGSRNDRLITQYHRRVAQINNFESDVRQLDDAALKAQTEKLRERLRNGERVAALLPEVFATAREAMDRHVGIRNIFNPEHLESFPKDKLSARNLSLYEETLAKAQSLEPIEVQGGSEPVPGWMQMEIPTPLYGAVRELFPESRPPFRARPFDVQLIGGMVLGEGKIAEMKTGEGKTIVGPLACYLACVEDLQCSVVTVNDYLVQRDRDWVFPFYYWLGLTVGAIHPFHMQPPDKKVEAYHCDVLYGTNSEFGFDYLRDNMKLSAEEQVQKRRDFCIIDEVDSILIDEARTPLIISGPAHEDAPRYDLADQLARHLQQKQREWDRADKEVEKVLMRIKGLEGEIRNARDKAKVAEMKEEMKQLENHELPKTEMARDKHIQYYEVEMDKKAAHLTHEGVAEAQQAAGVDSFYSGENMDIPHLLENSLRAHVVYQRDKDYVVQNSEVIIVDEFTGRLMVGRQWSNGLHQAVEAKEGVKIKEETQTMATVTIQNYFKLYKRLAGMTGTAVTEQTEFHEIYGLEVVVVPTNVPIVRDDRDDLIYPSTRSKWDAILEEIAAHHDMGRPVLVGTTSVNSSEHLSELLTKHHGIPHEVLNAKKHERESQMVANAGQLGAVMVATNMAGRGTDIKLQSVGREELIKHWQKRNLMPAEAKPEMSDEELINLAYRHIAKREMGLSKEKLAELSDDEVYLQLLREWVRVYGVTVMFDQGPSWRVDRMLTAPPWHDENYVAHMPAEECLDVLDRVPAMVGRHRLKIWNSVEAMGGLHIVGTERHESRRIDNQLRGRAGRQGDRGSSRFFVSLEDPLMQMFASKTMMAALSKFGFKEGEVLEHKWLTNAFERAQRQVEQRNYQVRKNLLEYDEVMEHQRSSFYSLRQQVLEGRDVGALAVEYIRQSAEEGVERFLQPGFTGERIADWAMQALGMSIDPARINMKDPGGIEKQLLRIARDELSEQVERSLSEYLSIDLPPEDWDVQSLCDWANARYDAGLKPADVRQMNIDEIRVRVTDAAAKRLEHVDLSGLSKFLEPHYAERELAEWAQQKFLIEVDPEEVASLREQDPYAAIDHVTAKVVEAYREKEVTYGVQFALDMAFQVAQQDSGSAASQLADWANARYDLGWDQEKASKMTGGELQDALNEASREWLHGGKLEQTVDEAITTHNNDPEKLAEWAQERFHADVSAEDLANPETRRDELIHHGRKMLRIELAGLERFVLLQVLDQAWKDHLYAMDQLKEGVGLRGYAERDPRIEYKREGARLFRNMQELVRDRAAELLFRARLTPQTQARSVYAGAEARHDDAGDMVSQAAGDAPPTEAQQRDQAAANAAGSGDADDGPTNRHQRRAAEARARTGEGGGPSPDEAKRGRRTKRRRR